MARYCYVPEVLKSGPFTLEDAAAAGLTRRQLRGSAWRHVSHGWYRWVGCPMSDELRLVTILRRLPPGAAFSGPTAARILGLDVPAGRRPEVISPPLAGIADRIQAIVRRVDLAPDDVVQHRRLPVTSPLRTCFDLAGRHSLVEGVVAVDMALHAGLVDLGSFRDYVLDHAEMAGVARARRVLEHVEPKSESPMETRMRMLLILDGLPRPEAQVSLVDAGGGFVARADLYYPDASLAVEYDGGNHRDRLVEDDRRQNRLQQIGVTLLRYTAPDLAARPDAVAAEARAALAPRKGPNVRNRTLTRVE